jgi:uncharacterized phage protein gp47/JayE
MPTFRVFDVDALPSTQDLLSESLVNIVATTPGITDIAVGSKLWSICYAIARQKASIYYTLHFYKKQSYVITASGKYLDLHGIEVGVFRQPAISARGQATFSRTSPSAYKILIPSGTVVTTPVLSTASDVKKFVTTEDVFIEVGGTTATVDVAAAVAGETGNLPAGAIARIEAPIAGVQAVTATSTSGGTEIESDESLRERILSAWAGRMSGTSDAIRDAILSVTGIRSVLIIDPARNRVKQSHMIKSLAGQPMVSLETKTPLEAKYDLYSSLQYEDDGLTLNIKQYDDTGNLLYAEKASALSDGISVLAKVNYLSKSAIIEIFSIALDDNPYDDLSPVATDRQAVYVRTLSEEVSNQPVTLIIAKDPSNAENKRLVVSTFAQFRHNEILGQTEVTPLVEVFDGFQTYSGMCNKVNAESKLIQMELLDVKVATEELMPTWNQAYSTNTVQTKFRPIVELLSPTGSNFEVLDQTNGIIKVGSGAVMSAIEFSYRYETDFGSRSVEELTINLQDDGSSLVYAMPLTGYSDELMENVSYLTEIPAVYTETKMEPHYELVRGRIDVVPVPYALPISDELVAEVVAAAERVKPAGVELYIQSPSVQYIDVSVVIEVETKNDAILPSQFYETIRTNITNYINQLDMGEAAYVERIIAAANPDIEGLKVAHVLSPENDISPAPLTFLRAGTIEFVE